MNVGKPREIGQYRGQPVISGIYKSAVEGEVEVRKFGVVGDGQASPSVHGGEEMAAYAYPSEHYAFWRKKFPGMALEWGVFGENLTTKGLLEAEVKVGDTLRIGTASFVVTKPRLPCYKLGIKFGTQEMVDWFLDSEYTGFYLKVVDEGVVKAGDEIEFFPNRGKSKTIASVVQGVKKEKEW